MSKKRRNFSAEEKLSLLRRHLICKENVSDICEEIKIHPSQFYKWQGELFDNGVSFFTGKNNDTENKLIKQLKNENAKLSQHLGKKDSVIAEITEEFVRLKKKSTGLLKENG